jgi:hypothetical protein
MDSHLHGCDSVPWALHSSRLLFDRGRPTIAQGPSLNQIDQLDSHL